MKGRPTRRAVTPDDVRRWPCILTQTMYTRGEVERFLAKVDIQGEGRCWPWTSNRVAVRRGRNDGYGALTGEGRPYHFFYAHRMSLELATGEPLGALLSCHSCDFGLCCNPACLFAGTEADNAADREAKGRRVDSPAYQTYLARCRAATAARDCERAARREARRQRTAARDADIRGRYAAGETLTDIAADHGISLSMASLVSRGLRGSPLESAA